MTGYFVIARLFLLASVVLGAVSGWSAEEAFRTPSDQMREAVSKLGKAPAAVGKAVRDLTDSAQQNLRQTLGGKADADARAEPADLDLPEGLMQPPAAIKKIQTDGSRDPFRPMTLRPRVDSRPRENLSPLERLELSQLKLVGIVWDIKEPRAMVEDSTGLGYTIRVGTAIGNNNGKVKAIRRNEVVIEESFLDVAGVRKKHDVSLKLATQ